MTVCLCERFTNTIQLVWHIQPLPLYQCAEVGGAGISRLIFSHFIHEADNVWYQRSLKIALPGYQMSSEY